MHFKSGKHPFKYISSAYQHISILYNINY